MAPPSSTRIPARLKRVQGYSSPVKVYAEIARSTEKRSNGGGTVPSMRWYGTKDVAHPGSGEMRRHHRVFIPETWY